MERDCARRKAMEMHEKIRTIPTLPGCYLYKNAEGG